MLSQTYSIYLNQALPITKVTNIKTISIKLYQYQSYLNQVIPISKLSQKNKAISTWPERDQ